MPDPKKPETWTPDYAWNLIDRVLLQAKVNEISREMQEKLRQAKATAHAEAVKRGNPAFYPHQRIRDEEAGAEEWAEKLYAAALDVWKKQGYIPCRAFFEAVYGRLVGLTLSARKNSVKGDLKLEDMRTGRAGHSEPHIESFGRAISRMQNRWKNKMDVAATEQENAERLEQAEAEAEVIRQGVALRSQALLAIALKKVPQKRKLTKAQENRRRRIFGVLQMGYKGRKYCQALDDRKLPIPEPWRKNGCPRSYSEAYRSDNWKQSISNEKSNHQRLYDRMTPSERERFIES
jgi:hypothetical protein